MMKNHYLKVKEVLEEVLKRIKGLAENQQKTSDILNIYLECFEVLDEI